MPRRINQSRKDSFENFYLTKVALGDCCGCAERVIDWRDIELAAQRNKMHSADLSMQRLSKQKPSIQKPSMQTPLRQRPTMARRVAASIKKMMRLSRAGSSLSG